MSDMPQSYPPVAPSSSPFQSGSGFDIDALAASFVPSTFSSDSLLDASSTYDSNNIHASPHLETPDYPLLDMNQGLQIDFTANFETFLTDFPRFPESP